MERLKRSLGLSHSESQKQKAKPILPGRNPLILIQLALLGGGSGDWETLILMQSYLFEMGLIRGMADLTLN